jgi:ectoine hydroxylase-related dioxygenase (phytanoyl-CoA dioxygenase family)
MRLSDAQLAQYRTDGWCTTGPVLTPPECDAIAAEYDRLQLTIRLGTEADGPVVYQPMLFAASALLTRTIVDPRLVEIMLQLIGPNVRMYWEQMVAKPAGARTELPWHQDDGYAPTDPPGYATAWLALDRTDESNGCIWVLPRSHTGGIYRHRMAGAHFRSGIEEYAGPRAGVPVPLAKGAILLFSSLTLHRSGPNVSGRPRRGWIIQYCDAACRHGNTGERLDDRVWVAREGVSVERPWAERPIDVGRVFASWTPVT